ncbi:MAG: hypothetical protein EA397_09475 [Deltaproteobacteria bacterium]|nr:MAG: hypothetical protein EA397_09475 [Deltaproteobacteria bacterium]
MRWILLLLSSSCGWSYGEDEVGRNQLCVEVEGQEVCAEGVATRMDSGRGTTFRIMADVQVPGVDFGWERTTATIEGEVPASSSSAPLRIDAVTGFVPAKVTCIIDEAHGDHCHLGVPYERACALEMGEMARVRIDRFDDQGIALRFEGRSTTRVPDCCVNSCDETDRDPWTRPELPFDFAGAVSAEWVEVEDSELQGS